MAQAGLAYVLTGPDGTRVAFNDRTDPDFIGFLDGEDGITGLLDVADTRESADDLTEGDGGVHGSFWLSRRSGTLQGLIDPVDAATSNLRESKLKRATRALRADATLAWTQDGRSYQSRLLVRRGAGKSVQITGRRARKFTVSLVSADPYVLAAAESNLVIVPGAAGGELGIVSPISSPLQTTFGAAGNALVNNQGDSPTWPRFRIDGPITNPTLLNNTTGLRINLVYTLAAGEYLIVDSNPRARTILLSGTASRASAYQRSSSTWWPLLPGNNDVRLLATAYSSGAQLTVYWRHADE